MTTPAGTARWWNSCTGTGASLPTAMGSAADGYTATLTVTSRGHFVNRAAARRARMLPSMANAALLVDTLMSDPGALLTEWLSELKQQGIGADHRVSDAELGQQGRELLQLLGTAAGTGTGTDVRA